MASGPASPNTPAPFAKAKELRRVVDTVAVCAQRRRVVNAAFGVELEVTGGILDRRPRACARSARDNAGPDAHHAHNGLHDGTGDQRLSGHINEVFMIDCVSEENRSAMFSLKLLVRVSMLVRKLLERSWAVSNNPTAGLWNSPCDRYNSSDV